MGRIRTISHKNQQILFIDYSGCEPHEVLAIADEVQRTITAQPHNSVLALCDFSGAKFDHKALMRLKEVAAVDKPHVKRTAFIGAESVPAVLHQGLKYFSQREFPSFKSRDEALEWLVGE
jgi:hypothetical protein